MTTQTERYSIYDKTFGFMISNHLKFPLSPIHEVCSDLGIELVSLSQIAKDLNLDRNYICTNLWGNENGHLMTWVDRHGGFHHKIAYNDHANHRDRMKFTIAEELAHIVLGHHLDGMYSINSNINDIKYKTHDKCARIAAGLIVCPPPIFYSSPALLDKYEIMWRCDISKSCATTRLEVLTKYKQEIMRHPLYNLLEEAYESAIASTICPYCNEHILSFNAEICSPCWSNIMEDFSGSQPAMVHRNR